MGAGKNPEAWTVRVKQLWKINLHSIRAIKKSLFLQGESILLEQREAETGPNTSLNCGFSLGF